RRRSIVSGSTRFLEKSRKMSPNAIDSLPTRCGSAANSSVMRRSAAVRWSARARQAAEVLIDAILDPHEVGLLPTARSVLNPGMLPAMHEYTDRAAPASDELAPFVRAQTALVSPPLVPELRLHLASAVTPLWHATEQTLEKSGLDPPYWAFAWPGGQA